MKKWGKHILVTVIMSMLLPQLVIAITVTIYNKSREESPTQTQPEQSLRQIAVLQGDVCVTMDMGEYLTGVVLQEMPAGFSLEAKKAQAVVARTYALRKAASDKHGGAVCTTSSCCQAYIDPVKFLEKGGMEAAVQEARAAVQQTEGLVLLYSGELIEATYFSCSGGKTEDAVAVWGSDIPYLQSVESPGEEEATHFVDTVTFSEKEFTTALGVSEGAKIGEPERTDGGGVAVVQIGDREFSGVEVRSLLGLRSTCFYITKVGSTVTVTTRGFGHRVGMSQYGADAMASNGSGFESILAHYYPGTELALWEDSE